MNKILEKVRWRDVPKYGSIVEVKEDPNTLDFNIGCNTWYSIPHSDLPAILKSIPILSMDYTDFRGKITTLLNEYDSRKETEVNPLTGGLEDSIDELFESLWKS